MDPTDSQSNSMTESEDLTQYFRGVHEVLEIDPDQGQGQCSGQAEVDLLSHKKHCSKRDRHGEFIPVNDFSPGHLPSGYHDNDVYQLVKNLAALTVKVAVKFTSLDRPAVVPDTSVPYPCFNLRGKNSLRTGTGKIGGFRMHKESDGVPCPCGACRESGDPCAVWGEVEVLTAKHVIYDDSEAQAASCWLWYDEEQSPVVTVTGWKVDNRTNIHLDYCLLHCTTHNLEIFDRLQQAHIDFTYHLLVASEKFGSQRDENKITIIVSHPHGCTKQVSVGRWVHRQVFMEGITRYTYTTCTCAGSSGAFVYRLGTEVSMHPHSGSTPAHSYSGISLEYS
ncbi:uncharacterized protein LOC131932588 [Physella acuta]|uniref:uncharacterized protein LOC131932588 n=1 Tax=Physella acuta TaxID=109671 RepID=UPI0027DE4B8A|nr:uncharacterized protein LOC131932588 [Physella acuta]